MKLITYLTLLSCILPLTINANVTAHASTNSSIQQDEANVNVLNNGLLKFGSDDQDSITNIGTLRQPFYFRDGKWYKLTFDYYPLDIAVAQGGDGNESWNTNGELAITNGGYNSTNFIMEDAEVNYEGFISTGTDTGYGTVIAKGTLSFNSVDLEIAHSYTLKPGEKMLKAVTKITNLSTDMATNVRLLVGTSDDYVGDSDSPTKTRGTITNGKFVALTQPSDRSNALTITSDDEGVLFYSTSSMVYGNTVSDYDFYQLFEQDPATAPIDNESDGAYGFFVRFPDLAQGESAEFDWFYAAASISEFEDLVADVSSAVSSNKTVTEDTALQFSAEDFKDTSNKVFEKINITALPEHGKLTLNGQAVAINTEIQQMDYAELTYTPELNYAGEEQFNWQGWSAKNITWLNDATTKIVVTLVNDIPVITGTPDTKVYFDALYRFVPTVTDVENGLLTFSILNKPSWANFDESTGTLEGTPSELDAGVNENIIISVNDGNGGEAQLAPFTLVVEADSESGGAISIWLIALCSMLIAFRRFIANKR